VLQEGEISADLFTFHEAVSQLQLLEEEVLDSHTSVAQAMPQWMELDRALLAMTNDVDYDQDGEICSSCNDHCSKKKGGVGGWRGVSFDGSADIIRSVLEVHSCVIFKTIGRMFTVKTIPRVGKSMDVKIIPQIRILGTFGDILYIGENWH